MLSNNIILIHPTKYSTNNIIIKVNTLNKSTTVNNFYYHLFLDLFEKNIKKDVKLSTQIDIYASYCEMTFVFQWIDLSKGNPLQFFKDIYEMVRLDFLDDYIKDMGKAYTKLLYDKAKESSGANFNLINHLVSEFYFNEGETVGIDEEENIFTFFNTALINFYTDLDINMETKLCKDKQHIDFNTLIKKRKSHSTTALINKGITGNFKQNQLYAFISAPFILGSYENIVLQVINGLLGRFPYSRLVRRIRDQENLAYYVKTRILNQHGIIVIAVQSDFPNEVTAFIKDEIDNLKSYIRESELVLVKNSLIHHFSKAQDNPVNEVNLRNQYTITKPEHYEQYKDLIKSVSVKHLRKVIETINLDVIYRIKE